MKAQYIGVDGKMFLKNGFTYEIFAETGWKAFLPVIYVVVAGDVLYQPTELVYLSEQELQADWRLLYGK